MLALLNEASCTELSMWTDLDEKAELSFMTIISDDSWNPWVMTSEVFTDSEMQKEQKHFEIYHGIHVVIFAYK